MSTTTDVRLEEGGPEPDGLVRPARPPALWIVGAALLALGIGTGVGLGATLWVVLAIAGVITALMALSTERGILHVLVLAPFAEGLEFGPISIGRLMAVGIVVVLFLRMVSGRLEIPAWRPATWLPAACLGLAIMASGLWAASPSGWTFEVGQLAVAGAFFAAFALLVTRPEQVTPLLMTYVVGATLVAPLGILQALSDARAVGLQGDANIFALYQVAAVPAAIALARQSSGVRRAAWILTILPILGSVFASESRGAFLALAATALLLALASPRRKTLLPLTAVAAGGAAVVASMLNNRYSVDRVTADRASGRIDLWHVAWQSFLDHPWLGIGSGSFKPQSIELLTTEPGVELVKGHLLVGDGSHVHSIYLETLAEGGIVTFTALITFLGLTAWNLFVLGRRYRTPVIAALLPMLVSFCVAAVFLSIMQSKLLWMLAGLAAALHATRTRGPAVHVGEPQTRPTAAVG